MRDRDIETSARRAGLIVEWRDAFGKDQRVSPESLRALLEVVGNDSSSSHVHKPMWVVDAKKPIIDANALGHHRRLHIELEQGGTRDVEIAIDKFRNARFNTPLPPGYHRAEIGGRGITIAAAPARCFSVADAARNSSRLFGIAAQIYSLRRPNDFGYGDFTALAQFAESAARHGASAIALSPVHAMFGADAARFSPYSPSHRAFINTLYANPQSISNTTTTGAKLDSLRRSRLIDWPKSATQHRKSFERAFRDFQDGRIAGAGKFEAFVRHGGNELQRHACFETLEEFAQTKPAAHSRAARDFADMHRERLRFHAFLQWRASADLSHAQSVSRSNGMPIGLIADLAVGVDPQGSECWSHPRDMLIGATIGAPPDGLNALGQSWGLTTFSPGALARTDYAPFLAILRAAMRHAGGVRLDHVMSLMRLWLVPNGASPTQGAYLRYPFDDLVRIVALESWRNRCIVIGEDLGTVPDKCRARLARAGILGLDVLPFMRDGNKFTAPSAYRGNAVAMTSTHDLAPIAGWWASRDLAWRRRLHLFGERGESDERQDRVAWKSQLTQALQRSGIARVTARSEPARVVDASIEFVGASVSPLAIVPVEDLVAASEAPNLPGTIAEHPNWRRRYPADADRVLDAPRVAFRLRRLARRRKAKR